MVLINVMGKFNLHPSTIITEDSKDDKIIEGLTIKAKPL